MIFQQQNVMGPAHRQGVIQQLAQNAAQNVLRRQKLKSLLSNTAGQAAAAGVAQPFRASTMGHPTAARGATFRPTGDARVGLANVSPGGGVGQQFAAYADPGPADLPSLPATSAAPDPSQSPASTAPGPNTAAQIIANGVTTPQQSQALYDAGGAVYAGILPNGTYTNDDLSAPQYQGRSQGGLIPLGSGMFYDPVTDTVQGATGAGVRPGSQMG